MTATATAKDIGAVAEKLSAARVSVRERRQMAVRLFRLALTVQRMELTLDGIVGDAQEEDALLAEAQAKPSNVVQLRVVS